MGPAQVKLLGIDGSTLAGVDDHVGGLVIVQAAHSMIHEGTYFTASTVATKNAGQSLELRILAPASPIEIHLLGVVGSSDNTTFYFYEGTSKTHVVGNAIAPVNRNRNSTTATNVAQLCHTPAGSGDGTLLWSYEIGDRNQPALFRENNEFILKYGTAYLFRATSGANGDVISIEFDWYEATES